MKLSPWGEDGNGAAGGGGGVFPPDVLPAKVEFTLDEAVDITEVISATEVIVVGSIDGEGWVTSIVAPSREILVISLLPAGGCTPKIGHNVTQINPRFEAGSTFT